MRCAVQILCQEAGGTRPLGLRPCRPSAEPNSRVASKGLWVMCLPEGIHLSVFPQSYFCHCCHHQILKVALQTQLLHFRGGRIRGVKPPLQGQRAAMQSQACWPQGPHPQPLHSAASSDALSTHSVNLCWTENKAIGFRKPCSLKSEEESPLGLHFQSI